MGERIEPSPDTSDERLAELIRWTRKRMPDVHALLLDLQSKRAMVKRLEAWSVELDVKRDQPGDVGHFIAAELRNRMKEPGHG